MSGGIIINHKEPSAYRRSHFAITVTWLEPIKISSGIWRVAAHNPKNITELEATAQESSETLPEVGVWLYISFAAGHNSKRVFCLPWRCWIILRRKALKVAFFSWIWGNHLKTVVVLSYSNYKSWKHSLEMLAHIDRIASCSWWRFVGCTSRARCSLSMTVGPF